MAEEATQKDIFTILYEVRDHQYLIGVTNEEIPTIATVGVNTSRPLPQNIRRAVIETVMELKNLTAEPKMIDYNAPSVRFSKTILSNFAANPLEGAEQPIKTIPEALAELKAKMMKEKSKD